ncbi:hypothetical protein VKT23_007979 [Stygiomarasmius scandens]|uniref:DUF6534 domain-containing protein n=1 Tax=Marasmiellus scandens TaxID=2682957 RepID=A0ABR1JNM6_9AGAR
MNLNEMLGTILLGTWANAMLYMLEIIQLYKYFTHGRSTTSSDRIVFKIVAMVIFLADTVCTIAECAIFYLYSVVHWGEPQFIAIMLWPVPVYLASTGVTGTVVQMFMLYRYWKLNKNLRRRYLSFPIIALILLSFAGSLMMTSLTAMFPQTRGSQKNRLVFAAFLWLVSSAVADLVIAIALYISIIKESTIRTKKSSRQLATLALKTGFVTATIALAALISYVIKPETNVSFIFSFAVGRLYALTFLYNLNAQRATEQRQNAPNQTVSLELTNRSRSTRTDDTISSGNLSRLDPNGTKFTTFTALSTQYFSTEASSEELGIASQIPTAKSTVLIEEEERPKTRSSGQLDPLP